MCGGHLESDGARKAEMSMRWEKGGDSRRREVRVLSINKKSEFKRGGVASCERKV